MFSLSVLAHPNVGQEGENMFDCEYWQLSEVEGDWQHGSVIFYFLFQSADT